LNLEFLKILVGSRNLVLVVGSMAVVVDSMVLVVDSMQLVLVVGSKD